MPDVLSAEDIISSITIAKQRDFHDDTAIFFFQIGAIGGIFLVFTPSAQAQTSAYNASQSGASGAPSKDDIVKALTPAPAPAPAPSAAPTGPRTRGVGQRGLGRVNSASAAAPEQPPSSEMRDSPNSTYFEFNSSQLTPFGLKVVDEYVKALKDPMLVSYSFRIIGHTDGVGADHYNDELSRKRAQSVRNYMIAHGVDPLKLDTLGMGKRELKNRDNPASAENRRVVILNLGQK